jgi:hypothetical protein
MNEYMCGKVLSLIAEMSTLLSTHEDLLMPTLLFLSNTLQYSALAVVSSLSLFNLLEEVDEFKSSASMSENVQDFLSQAYDYLFRLDTPEKVTENLAKAMAVFIYKFKRTL